jgi:uncharacterized membrane protein YgcG
LFVSNSKITNKQGMMSLVITPGNGIYEVSRELTKLTKDRVIDNGIGSDLVCLGEQPLHCVPLFKYATTENAFTIPHWINISFYKSSETVRYCNSTFLPTSKIRIKKSINTKATNDDHETDETHVSNAPAVVADAILPGYSKTVSVNLNDSDSVASYLKSLEDTDYIFEHYPNKKFHSESSSEILQPTMLPPPSAAAAASAVSLQQQQGQTSSGGGGGGGSLVSSIKRTSGGGGGGSWATGSASGSFANNNKQNDKSLLTTTPRY